MKALNIIRVLPVLFLLLCCTGKKQNTIPSKPKDVCAYPGEYEADSPSDIRIYMDSLCKDCQAGVWIHSGTPDEESAIWRSVDALASYAVGEMKYFPVKELRKTLEALAFEQGYMESHAVSKEGDGINGGEIFLFRLMEQAARYCPQIDYLSDFHTPDCQAGVIYYPGWSANNPLYSILMYKSGESFKLRMIGEKGDAKIEKIFHLKDERGRDYFLCSNNESSVYFRQFVYWRTGGELKLVCQTCKFLDDEETPNNAEIVFNPQKLCWNYCSHDGGYYHKIKGTGTMFLRLDGMQTVFERSTGF